MYMVIDGYNIINNWQDLKLEAKSSLEDARQKLIDILLNFRGYTGFNIILVFDAMYVKGNQQKHEYYSGLEVVYTKEGESADSYIEGIIKDIIKKDKVVVVTSDWVLQQVVLAQGAIRMSARELYEELNDYLENKKKLYAKDDKKDSIESRLSEEIIKKLRKMAE
ncbi:NYN domain-containing protein [Thermoanaerobacterium sp. CMT5567-10]|uniref:NYN domain-containing protein n=1 Tax=Thermoanaerobacterium sp. CMT5567-10 TaxID=3061989 RepID=UPI0026DEFDE3|nr:NYN domain-containing protein [Thermoanaerobacterium sp. CMT5567-10]WKV07939.1 NYN domain-containing protein [Thermoanaerobacterium sp. CMT5567-10]